MISIIIPVYNRPKLVAECLDSVLAQTNPNWECIVVDDGSTDNTWEVLEDYAKRDNRIRIFKRDREPKGAPTCRNIGATLARGKLILFFDSDDILFPYAIDQKIKWMNTHTDVDCGVCQQINIDTRGNNKIWYRSIEDTAENYLIRLLTFQTAFSTHSVVWRKSAYIKSSKWDESLKSYQDPPLHAKSILRGLKFKWMSILPTALIRQFTDNNRITTKSKFSNFIDKMYEIISLNDSLKKDKKIKQYIKSKLYQTSYFMNEYSEITSLANECLIDPLFNKNEKTLFKFHFWLYSKSKNNSLFSSLVYKSGFLFYKRKDSFVRIAPQKQELDMILYSLKNIPQEKYRVFINIPLARQFLIYI